MIVTKYYYLLWIILNLPCYESRKIKYFKPGKSCGGQTKIQHITRKLPDNEIPECSIVSYYDTSEFKTSGVFGSWSPTGSWSSCDTYCGGGTRTRPRTCTGSGSNPVCPGNAVESEVCNAQSCFDCSEYDVDYYGSDVELVSANTVEECKLKCQQRNECLLYSYLQPQKDCHMKYARSTKAPWISPTLSGPKVCHGSCLQFNTNTAGTVLADKQFDSPEDCQRDCYINRNFCSHFVFYTGGHSDSTKHRLCRQFTSVTGSTFSENGCIFGPNRC